MRSGTVPEYLKVIALYGGVGVLVWALSCFATAWFMSKILVWILKGTA